MAKVKVLEFILKLFAGSFQTLLDGGGAWVENLLNDGYEKEPALLRELIPVLYKYWDTLVEDYAARTKHKADDKIVLEIKQAIERFAAAHSIALPNADAGQPGD